ncbi:MAG: VIT1/CCC1 family protein [Nitrososphaeria archaeon]
MLDQNLKSIVLEFQRKEITEHTVYKRLAEKSKGKNAEVLRRISDDELRHYNEWKKYTRTDVQPNRLAVLKYLVFSKIFGLTFMMKIMEAGEERAQEAYDKISDQVPKAREIHSDEYKHEHLLIDTIDERRLDYVGSMVQGLNDALIGLSAEMAGLTFALTTTWVIGIVGLISGIAQFLSMFASEIEIFLTQRTQENKEALQTSFFAGVVYVFTVLFLVIPYFISTSYSIALSVTLLNTLLIIVFFTFFVSVVKETSLRKMFTVMIFISLGVAGLSFVIGWSVKALLGV